METPDDLADRVVKRLMDVAAGKVCLHDRKHYVAISVPGRTTLTVHCSNEQCRAYLGTVG